MQVLCDNLLKSTNWFCNICRMFAASFGLTILITVNINLFVYIWYLRTRRNIHNLPLDPVYITHHRLQCDAIGEITTVIGSINARTFRDLQWWPSNCVYWKFIFNGRRCHFSHIHQRKVYELPLCSSLFFFLIMIFLRIVIIKGAILIVASPFIDGTSVVLR